MIILEIKPHKTVQNTQQKTYHPPKKHQTISGKTTERKNKTNTKTILKHPNIPQQTRKHHNSQKNKKKQKRQLFLLRQTRHQEEFGEDDSLPTNFVIDLEALQDGLLLRLLLFYFLCFFCLLFCAFLVLFFLGCVFSFGCLFFSSYFVCLVCFLGMVLEVFFGSV